MREQSYEGLSLAIQSYTTVKALSSTFTQAHMDYLLSAFYNVFTNRGKDYPMVKEMWAIISAYKICFPTFIIQNGYGSVIDNWITGLNNFSFYRKQMTNHSGILIQKVSYNARNELFKLLSPHLLK